MIRQIKKIRALEDGWLYGEGSKYDPHFVDWLSEWIALTLNKGEWSLYPNPNGGVNLEKSINNIDFEIYITYNENGEKAGLLSAIELTTGKELVVNLALNCYNSCKKEISQVEAFFSPTELNSEIKRGER